MRRLVSIALALPLLLASCNLYRHTVVPLDVAFDATPARGEGSKGSVKRITYQYLDVEWGRNGVVENALRDGLTRVYFLDKEVLSVLGFWTQTWVHVYGE